jgi:hypothetical protein
MFLSLTISFRLDLASLKGMNSLDVEKIYVVLEYGEGEGRTL